MKLVVTGASGLYGSKLVEFAVDQGHQVYAFHNQHPAPHGTPVKLDITSKEELQAEIQRIQPDAIVHAATLTGVDQCELNRELAWKINVEGTQNIVEAAKATGAFLLYISTDYVFDGEKGGYKEDDLPSPVNYYGYTKLKAEEAVRKSSGEYCIGRTSVIYGSTPAAGKINFALWLLDKLRKREQVKVFVDQWNSPTLNSSLADMTLEVVERKLTGVFHLSGASRINRYEFAMALAKTSGVDESLVVPARSEELSFPAKRPKDSSLDTTKAQQTLKHKPLQIAEALKRLKTETNKPQE
jgi:dTDP-4-dehydrorhamnose reductase